MSRTLVIALISIALGATVAGAQVVGAAAEPRTVTMSLAEYNRLLDLERRAPTVPAVAPVAAVVSSADLKIAVGRDNVRGTFNLAGQVLRSGVSRVPLVNGATLADVTAGGRPVPLVTEGQALQALIAGPGNFAITAEWGGPISFIPGRAAFVIPVPQAGAARATIEFPGEQADVHLSAGLITRRNTANGRTTVDVTLDPGSSTEVWWSMRDSAPVAAVKDLRALAEVMTLITLDDSDVRMAALVDVSVTQGELRTLRLHLPDGYEFQSVSGSTLEEFSEPGRDVILTVGNPAARSHQFLVTLERAHSGGSFTLDTGVVTIADIQRERGEIAIEGVGTMDLSADERGSLHRMDVRELQGSLQSLARLPILSAFRYQRPAGSAAPQLALDVKRFADAGVLAAAADRAVATTLITSEGRALTEIQLDMRNRSQPFLKVDLPPGASIVSVDISGQSAKPASGADGTRIPLMRAGLPLDQPYSVSFVYVHAGTPFLKKGDIAMSLPKMDVPIGLVQWEVFVPEQYKARAVDGNMIESRRYAVAESRHNLSTYEVEPVYTSPARFIPATGIYRDQVAGHVVDTSGAALPGVTVRLRGAGVDRQVETNGNGDFVFSGVPHGETTITGELAGFQTRVVSFPFDGSPRRLEMMMGVSSITETVTVTGQSPMIDEKREPPPAPPSQNVVNLQQRAAGVLPIRVDVPRAGVSHEFIKPLVVASQATVTLRYKRN